MTLSATLEKAIIKYPQKRKSAQLSTRLLRNIVFLHVYLAGQLDHQSDQLLHANYAIQFVGVALKHAALSYERPSNLLWECMSECYVLALHEDFLDRTVKNLLTEFKVLSTISLALKRLLLFSLANPYQYSQKDILSLYDFCTQNSVLIHFVHQGMSLDHVFCWDYTANDSFQPVYTRSEKLPYNSVLFHTNALVHAKHNKALTIEGADLLIASLNQYRDLVASTKFTLAEPFIFVSSFEQVFEFFSTHIHKHQILIINTPTPKDLNFSSLELLEEKEKKKVVEHVSPTDIWGSKQGLKEKVRLKFGSLKLVQTSLPLIFVAESVEAKLVSGDIFICYDSSLKLALGITRHVELKQQGAIQKSVVELCRGQVSLLQQTGPVTETTIQALLLENEAKHELFLASGKYSMGTVLEFDQIEVVLERLLELSPTFMRYAVSVRELSA